VTKLILKCNLSPGDIVMLTAAVRDLHRLHPGQFLTDVRTPCPDLWLHNPCITPLQEDDPKVRVIECHYPLIGRSNQEPWHFLHGYARHLGQELGLEIHPTAFRGDIHLSEEEREAPSPVEEHYGKVGPYWIIVGGGKYDYTIKWWHRRRWQQVVDALRDRITFVQVGEKGHYHPLLKGVLDMRGRTTLRELVRVVHRSEGVICPVTCLSHLAAAVPLPAGRPGERPCVVVAGGREAPHWETYPWQRFLHTIGMLPCCASGGCWKARSVALGDGNDKDAPHNLCSDFVADAGLPRCMEMISPKLVIDNIESYLNYGQPSF
jgi:ADP-heptose:LPS heptosyltransferase